MNLIDQANQELNQMCAESRTLSSAKVRTIDNYEIIAALKATEKEFLKMRDEKKLFSFIIQATLVLLKEKFPQKFKAGMQWVRRLFTF